MSSTGKADNEDKNQMVEPKKQITNEEKPKQQSPSSDSVKSKDNVSGNLTISSRSCSITESEDTNTVITTINKKRKLADTTTLTDHASIQSAMDTSDNDNDRTTSSISCVTTTPQLAKNIRHSLSSSSITSITTNENKSVSPSKTLTSNRTTSKTTNDQSSCSKSLITRHTTDLCPPFILNDNSKGGQVLAVGSKVDRDQGVNEQKDSEEHDEINSEDQIDDEFDSENETDEEDKKLEYSVTLVSTIKKCEKDINGLEHQYSQILQKRHNACAAKFKVESADDKVTKKTKIPTEEEKKKTEEKKKEIHDYYKKEYYKYDHQLKIVQKALDKAKNND